MAVLAGFGVVVSRWAGVEDVAVGTPVAGRGAVELEPLIGLFMNALVIRSPVPRAAGFRAVLRAARAAALDAYAHQEVPFERLVEELAPRRELGRAPLCQVWFEMDTTPAVLMDLPGARASELEVPLDTAKFDVSVSLVERDGGLDGALVFRRDLFSEDTGRRLAAAFTSVLEQVAADPDARVGELAVMSEQERRLVVGEYNATGRPARAGTVPEWIAARAADCPDAPAVLTADGGCWSYAELDARANQTAWFLRGAGVRADEPVAVCLDRGFDLVATLLGVLRAGAAYLPLDPGFPVERCRFAVDDTGARILLTQQRLTDRLRDLTGQVVPVDLPDGAIARAPADDPGIAIDPRSLAYIIYTSGSTGRPKGVMVEHATLANFTQWCVDGYAHRRDGGAPLFSSLAFDAVVPNLYTPLVLGQPVHVFDQDLDLSRLGAQLTERGPFSFIKLTPSHLELLSRQLDPDQLADLAGVLVVGAEAFPASMLRHWPLDRTDTTLLNEYGPTEATVANSVYHVTGPVTTTTVPIGSPIPNTTMYVLDPDLNPVPIGVTGELYIGGNCLARGYHARPALTADRFLPDPYTTTPGARLYRTGDHGRMLPTGAIEFLGRTDDQIKIRGHRIEPGEIETALTHHPSISAAHVTPLTDPHTATPTALIAYLVPTNPTTGIDNDTIHHHLANTLPHYLHPQHLITIPTLPLTPHGKIDRTALPQPTPATNPYQPPTTPLQHQLTTLWNDLLHHPHPIGIHDNFFDLGGHSLLAVQLLSRIRQHTTLTPTLTDLFEHPTIAQLTTHTTQIDAGAGRSTVVTLRPPAPDGRVLWCVHPSGGSVHWYRHIASALDGPDGLLAFQARGIDGEEAPLATIDDMARAYVADLRRLQPAGPYFVLGWSLSGPLALAMAALLEQAGEPVWTLLLEPTLPDAATVEALRATIDEHRRAAGLIDEMVARADAGSPVDDVEARMAALIDESDVVDASLMSMADSRPVVAAGLLYEAFCSCDVAKVAGEVTVLVTPECVAADAEHRSKAATTTYAEYERNLRRLIGDVRIEEVGGDHLSMVDDEHAPSIVTVFRRMAAEAERAAQAGNDE